MSSYGTAAWDEELFAPIRFRIPDISPPPHATRCSAHGWYRGPHCPKCLLALEELGLREEIRRVARQVRLHGEMDLRCGNCGDPVPFGQRVYCSRPCYLAASERRRRRP